MNNMDSLFFELLQVAIGTRKSLPVKPTYREWALLFEMSKKQALTAIAFRGVKTLSTSTSSGHRLKGRSLKIGRSVGLG